METIDKQFASTELNVSAQSENFLLYASKWANFLAILGFIGLGLMVLGGLIVMVVGSSVAGIGGAPQLGMLGIIYVVMAALYFFPTLYLYKFGIKIKNALATTSQDDLDLGFENLKSFFKFIGIFTIIMIGLYVLAIIIGLGTAMAMR